MIDANYTNAYYNRGCIYFDFQNYEKSIIYLSMAIKDLGKSTKVELNHTHFYYVRGCAYDILGNYTKAILDFNKAIKVDSKFTVAYNSRGDTYRKLGRLDQAEQDYKNAKELGL